MLELLAVVWTGVDRRLACPAVDVPRFGCVGILWDEKAAVWAWAPGTVPYRFWGGVL